MCMGHREMEAHLDPFWIALVMGFEPDDSRVLEKSQIVGMVNDAHRVGFVETHTMLDRDRRGPNREVIFHLQIEGRRLAGDGP